MKNIFTIKFRTSNINSWYFNWIQWSAPSFLIAFFLSYLTKI